MGGLLRKLHSFPLGGLFFLWPYGVLPGYYANFSSASATASPGRPHYHGSAQVPQKVLSLASWSGVFPSHRRVSLRHIGGR
jgi:hypothetical protein